MGRFSDLLKTMRPRSGRAVTESGRVFNVADAAKRADANNVWPFGEQLTGVKRDDISVLFHIPYLNTDFDVRTPVTTGDGSVEQNDGVLKVSSTTGTAEVETRQRTSYRPGRSGYIDFTARFAGTGKAIVGGKDTFQLRYSNGELAFGYVSGGDFISVPVDTSLISDIGNLNIYRIVYGYLGVATPTLLVKRGIYQEIARVETEGEIQEPHVDDPNFPIVWYTEDEATLATGSAAAGVVDSGLDSGSFRAFRFPSESISSGTATDQGDVDLPSDLSVATLAIFRSKDMYKGATNSVVATLQQWENVVEAPGNGAGEVIFQIIGNPSLSGTPAWNDIDADNSVFQFDHTAPSGASVDYASGGRVLLEQVVAYSDGGGPITGKSSISTTDAESLGATGVAGDTFVVIAKDKGGNGVRVRSGLQWKERF